uniref:Uncharacterized protein n=1 Tax=Haplochromis burtoni TaxID=8153 RepID=A0A3Q2VTZ3_HAPBU
VDPQMLHLFEALDLLGCQLHRQRRTEQTHKQICVCVCVLEHPQPRPQPPKEHVRKHAKTSSRVPLHHQASPNPG